MKDFTPDQAARWVAQEAAKHTTPESIRKRIASEADLVADRLTGLPGYPNSRKAHEDLVALLQHALNGENK